jgi:hypothetical protein
MTMNADTKFSGATNRRTRLVGALAGAFAALVGLAVVIVL